MTWWAIAQVIGGQILGGAGAMLILWGLLGDRMRGGHRLRRCPKCWFDLSQTQGLMCPECGRTARGERALHRARRYRLPAVAGVFVLLAGLATVARPWDASSYAVRLLPLRWRVELYGLNWGVKDDWLPTDLASADQALLQRTLNFAVDRAAAGQDSDAESLAMYLLSGVATQVNGAPALNAGYVRLIPHDTVLKAISGAPGLSSQLLRALGDDPIAAAAYIDDLAPAMFNPTNALVGPEEVTHVIAKLASSDPTARFALVMTAEQSSNEDASRRARFLLITLLPGTGSEVEQLIRSAQESGDPFIVDEIGYQRRLDITPIHPILREILADPESPLFGPLMRRFEEYPACFNDVLIDLLEHGSAQAVDAMAAGLRRRREESAPALLPSIRCAAMRRDLPASVRREMVAVYQDLRTRLKAPDPPLVIPELEDPAWDILSYPEVHR